MLNRTIAPRIKDAIEYDLSLKPCEKYELKNGVPVYAISDGAEEVSMVEFVFYAGNNFENKNLAASATNFLIRNGTSRKTALAISEHIDYYGAFLNRSCQNETAVITLHCLSRYLKELLPIIRELITDAVFPQQELEIYQQNSIQRLSVNLQKCDFVAHRLIDQFLYGEHHPYGRTSSPEDINAIDRSDLVDFFQHFYRNGQCIVFAAGKLPPDFQQQLDEQFGDLNLAVTQPEVMHKLMPEAKKKFRIENDANGVQGAIRLARPFPNRHHPDFKKMLVFNVLFGGYFGSRLMANIREDKGYTYGIHSYLENRIQQSAWVITTEVGKDVCEAAVEEIYKEMKIIREELADEEELLLVKNYLMGLNLGDLDGPFQVIARWKNLILNGLDENYFSDYINTVKNLTTGEVKELANKYLVPEEFFDLVVV